ncbi:vitamin-B12 independent methionine synthase [Gordonia desulfuricans]|uniref:Vitamin-B12 independent methionine synthase n=1 Tax=Gordonia desulfuricans TaxID=89051 RepID=A0A7K3LUD8_9ACTN|nr:vitamin-B12 independent methionine synthase [Gordonia desulfuricans]NDK91883.1 vitamin-B12 independent methionine synthase [Gordonia desulfuricans]
MSTLPTGIGTGVGSMPGTDPAQAAAVINGELDFAHLAELPARGIGADMIGRMAALLVDIPIDASTWGYRLGSKGSSVVRRARGFLSADLDVLEELWDTAGFIGTGRAVKVQVTGPYTLAASIELANGHKAIRDRGAVRDLADSGAEGLAAHVAEVHRRLGAEVIVQFDEPMIGAVIDGALKPLTRLDVIPAVPVAEVADTLGSVIERVGRPAILHNCGAPRWDLIRRMRGVAHGVDVTKGTSLSAETLDGIGELIDRGDVLVAGVLPGDRAVRTASADTVAVGLAELIDRIGLNRKVLAGNVIVTPTCGLAGATLEWARRALEICAKAGELLATDPEAL